MRLNPPGFLLRTARCELLARGMDHRHDAAVNLHHEDQRRAEQQQSSWNAGQYQKIGRDIQGT